MAQESPALSGQILEEQNEFSITEVCSICSVEERQVVELVEQGIIERHSVTQWRFSADDLRRARISLRLQRDLGVNPAGAALVLDLLERIEALERRLHGDIDDVGSARGANVRAGSRPGNRRKALETALRGGKSGLRWTECQVTPGGREPTESATESRPPKCPPEKSGVGAGKGETVR